MSAAIFFLAVCARDVMNKAGMRGRSVIYVISQPFCLLLAKSERTWLRPEELTLEANTLLPLHKYSYSKHTKPANKDICLLIGRERDR